MTEYLVGAHQMVIVDSIGMIMITGFSIFMINKHCEMINHQSK